MSAWSGRIRALVLGGAAAMPLACGPAEPPPGGTPPRPRPESKAAPAEPANPDPVPAPARMAPDVATTIQDLAAAAGRGDRFGVSMQLSKDCAAALVPFRQMRASDAEWSRFLARWSGARLERERVSDDRATADVSFEGTNGRETRGVLMVLEEGRWRVLED